GLTSGRTRSWTYTISNTGTSDTGAVSVVGGNFLTGIKDAAGNLATGTPTPNNGSFSANANTPVKPLLTLGTGISDGATRDEATASTGVVLVKAESGNTVVLTFRDQADRSVSKTITATGSSSQSVTLDAADIYSGSGSSTVQLHDGTITVSAIAQNAAGSTSSPSLNNFTLDTTPPSKPVLLLADAAGDGVSLAEATASTGVLTVKAEAGSKLVLTFATDATHAISKTVIATGFAQAISLQAGDLGTETGHLMDGSTSVTAIATDAAGNDSEVGSTSFSLITNAPSTTFSALAFNSDTGPHGVNNTDFITFVDGQTISATLSAALGTGQILKGSLNGGATWIAITDQINPQNNTNLVWTGVTLLAGKQQLLLKVTDAAGNDGPITTQAYELDQIAPTQYITTAALSNDTAAPDSSTKNHDFITQTATQTITATLSAPLGTDEVLWGSLDGGSAGNWVPLSGAAGFLTGTSLSWTGQTLLAGTGKVLKLKITDRAGNENSGLVFSQAYAVDSTAPGTTASTITLSADTGISSTDFLANEASQTLQGTLGSSLQPGESVYVSLNNGLSWSLASTSPTTFRLEGATLASGNNTLLVKVFDVAGNSGPAFSQAYTLDTTAPDAPGFNWGAGVSGGANQAEATQTSGVVTVSVESGASVKVTFSDGFGFSLVKNLTGTGTAQAVTLDDSDIGTGSNQLQDGSISVSAVATDRAGNTSSTGSFTFRLDTDPARPSLALGAGVDNGATKAEATYSGGVVTVSSESGATLAITFSDGVHSVIKNLTGNGLVQPVTLDATDIGTDTTLQLRDGTITVSAVGTDSAGSNSTPTTTSFTLDTSPPDAPELALNPAVSDGASLAEASNGDGVVSVAAENNATVLVTFTDSPGPNSHSVIKTVRGLGLGSAVKVTLAATDMGTGSLQLHDGAITVTSTATDVAGNTNAGSSSSSFILDTAAPEAPVIQWGADVKAGATLADAVQSSGVMLASAELGSTLRITFTDSVQPSHSVIRTLLANGSAQAITLDASDIGMGSNQLQDGTIRVTVTATDAAGNSSSSSSSFTLDTHYDTTRLLSLGSGAADLVSVREATQASAVVTLHAEWASTVRVTFTDAYNTRIVKVLTGTGVAGQAVQLTGSDFGSYANQLKDGNITVTATGIDLAGNVSTAFTQFVLDSQAPAQASVVMRKNLGGVFTLADITSAAGLFHFNTEAGGSVRADFTSTDAANGVSLFSKTYAYSGTAAWQTASLLATDIGTDANQLRPGTVSVRFVTVDAAGNESAASPSQTFTLDTYTHATPELTLTPAATNGVSKNEFDTATPAFSFTVPPQSILTYTITDISGNSADTSITNPSGVVSPRDGFLAPGYFPLDGRATVSAVVSSLAGVGTSAPGSTSFVLDTTAPTLESATHQPTTTVGGVNSKTITLGFSEPIDSTAFTLATANSLLVLENTTDGTTWTPQSSPYSNITFSGSTVTLTLLPAAIAVGAGGGYRISYTKPSDAPNQILRDTAGNNLVSLGTVSLNSSPQITGFSVSDSGNGNGTDRGKAGEAVSVLVNFSEAVTLSASTTYTVRVQIGSSNANFFDATLITPALAPSAAPSYAFAGTLPSIGGLISNALSITSLNNTGGTSNNIIASASRALSTSNLPLASAAYAYTVDTITPTVPITLAPNQVDWDSSTPLPAGHSAIIQFSFSENPGSSFSLDDIAVTGGTLSKLTSYGQTRYATFTPTANTNSGSAGIRVGAGSFADLAGNANADNPSLSFSYDTLPPTPPILRLGTGVTDGASADEATQNSGIISVQAEAGQAVELTFSNSSTPSNTITKTVTGAGMGSALAVVLAATEASQLGDGTVTVVAVATDAAGNRSYSNSSFTLDTMEITANPFTFVAGGIADPGSIFTRSPIVTVAGTGVPGGSRQFSTDGGLTWAAATPVTNAAGVVTGHFFQLESNTSYPPNAIQIQFTDAAGNSSIYLESRTVTIDTLAPSAPDLVFGDGFGTTTTAGVVGITAESGSTVSVTFTDNSNHSVTKSITGAASSVNLTLPLSDLGTGSSQLHDGTITVTAVATDSAGNASAASTSQFALNSTAPVLLLTSGQDRFVNSTETVVDIEVYSTALQDGDVLAFKIDSASFAGNSKTVSAAEASAGRVRFAISKTAFGTADGNKSLSAARTPAAGGPVVNSSALVLTLDTQAPATPTLMLDNAAINGATLADATRSAGVVLVNAESGASVAVTFSDGAHSVIKTITGQGANSAVPVTLSGTQIGSLSSQLHEGSISVRAVATDAAGNASVAGSSSFLLDTSKPNAPTLALASGVANGGATLIEAVSSLFTFTAESGGTVWLSFSDGVRTIHKAIAVNSSVPQSQVLLASELGTGTSQLHDGSIHVSAVVVDAAGNVSAVASTRFVLDTVPPANASLALGAGVGNGASLNEATLSGAVTVRAESGATVTLTFTDASNHSVIKTVTAQGTQSAVPVTLVAADFGNASNQLADGLISVSADTTDAAGNPAASQATISFSLDTQLPAAPTLSLGNEVSGVANLVEATQASGVITMNAASGNVVRVTFSDGTRTVVKTLHAAGSMAQAVTLEGTDVGSGSAQLHDGTITVTAVATDPADNQSAPDSAANATFMLDATVPLAPTLSLGYGVSGGATRYEALDVHGVVLVSAESGSTIVLTFTDQHAQQVFKTVVATGSSQPVLLAETDLDTLTEEAINVTAIATDPAGNPSSAGSTSFVLDFTRPSVTLSSSSSSTPLKMGETAIITFTFSEVPNGFSSTDFVVGGGGILGTLSTGTGKVRTALYTPASNINGGVVSINFTEGSYTDSAGNLGYGATVPVLRYDTKAPAFVFASVKDQTLTLNFDADIDPNSWSSPTAVNQRFTWKLGSGSSFTAVPNAFNNVLVSGTKVQLALASTFNLAQDAKISYTAPGGSDQTSNIVQDLAGNDLASFGDQSVYETPIIIDFSVSDIGNSNGVALGRAGEAVNVLVTFNEPVYFTSAATIWVRVQVGSNTSDIFDATFTTVPGGILDAKRAYTFTGRLPVSTGLSTNALLLKELLNQPGGGLITNGINYVPVSNHIYNLSNNDYTFDSLPPSTRINSHTGLVLEASKGQYATLPAAAAAIAGDITLEIWAYPIYPGGSLTGRTTLLNLSDAAGSSNITLGLNNGRLWFKAVNTDGSVLAEALSTDALSPNAWSHLAITVDSSHVLTLYLNGLPIPFSLNGEATDTSATLSAAIPSAPRSNNTISTANAANAFNGIISDLRLYNQSRSLAQIQSDLLGAVDKTLPIGYYPFANSADAANTPLAATPPGPATLINAPGYSTLANLRFNQDTGASAYDLITKISNQTVTVQLKSPLQTGEALWVSADSGLSWSTANLTPASTDTNNLTFIWTDVSLSPPLAFGQLPTLQFKVVDAALNDGPIVTQTYLFDNVAPVPLLGLTGWSGATGSGIPPQENGITGGATLAEATQTAGVLTVNSDSGSVVVITFQDSASPGNTVVKTVTTWTTSTPVVLDASDIGNGSNQLHDGTIRVSAIATDLAGNNTFIPTTTSFVLDTVAPDSQVGKQGLVLNASSKQYMALAQPASSFGNNITIETFIKPNAYGGTIFEFGESSNLNNIKLELLASGDIKFTAHGDSSALTPLTASSSVENNRMSLNEWHHLALSIQRNSATNELLIKIYLDDRWIVDVANGNNSHYIKDVARTNYFVGRSISSAEPNYLDATLANFRAYEYTRTLAQIQADAKGAVDASDTGLRFYYPFNGNTTSGISGVSPATPMSNATPASLPGYSIMTSFAPDSGLSATDLITNNTSPVIKALLSPAPADGEKLYGSINGGSTWQDLSTSLTNALLTWQLSFGANANINSTLQLKVVDSAGNSGPVYSHAFVIDTTAPAQPTVMLGNGITGTTNGATRTEALHSSGVLTVSAEAQARVYVTFTDSTIPTANRVIKTVITNGIGSATAVTLDATDLGYGSNQLHDGNITVTTSITDLAGNPGTAPGSTTFKLDTLAPQLDFRQGLHLNGASGQYARMPYLESASGNIGGDMTLEAWVYLNPDYGTGPIDFPIFSLRNYSYDSVSLRADSNGRLVFEAYVGVVRIMYRHTDTNKIAHYQWTHVALSISSASTSIAPQLYVNGIKADTGGTTISTNNTPIPSINRIHAYIGVHDSQYFNGTIANVRVYDNERTPAQIIADMNGSVDTADANLKAYYTLAGNTNSELTGTAGQAATLTAGPGYNTPDLRLSSDTAPPKITTTNSDFVFKTATQNLSFLLLNDCVAGETFTFTLNGLPVAAGWTPILGTKAQTINNLVFTEGSNTLRINMSDASGNTAPEYTRTFTLDTVAPTTGLPAGLQMTAANTQYATLPTFAAGTISGDLTMEAWVNYVPVTGTMPRTILKLGSGIPSDIHGVSTNIIALTLNFSAGTDKAKLEFKYDTGSIVNRTFRPDNAATPNLLTPNAWNHVAVTVDGSNALRLYLNGTLIGSDTLATPITSVERNKNILGHGFNVTNTQFNGSISDVRIYDNARTLVDIQSDMAGAVDVLDTNLKAYYPLNTTKSGLANGTALVLNGYPALSTPGYFAAKDAIAISTDAAAIGSNNDFVTNTSSQTISGKLLAPLQSGETVWVSINSGSTWNQATATAATSTWSLPRATLLLGSNTLQVKVSDVAGNDGPVATQAYTLDRTAPDAVLQTLTFSADTGANATDFITSTASQTITVSLSKTLATDETVIGSVDGGSTWVDVKKVSGGSVTGTTVTWPTTLATGTNTIKLKVADLAGNTGPELTQQYTKPAVNLGQQNGIVLANNSFVRLPADAVALANTISLEAWVFVDNARLPA
ncbi:MAG: Ig-like domain-containing protein, partial [Rhodoferax sp.]|nr:Ig-like domain-containing protein [Rhodoferax sp.]